MPNVQALTNLREIRHIVVLMMENRSFDQMLGFLSKSGRLPDVNGLTGSEVNYDGNGDPQQVFEWGPDETSFHPPQDLTGKVLDPCHGSGCVDEQLDEYRGERPGGFVKNFVATRKDREGHRVEVPPEYWRLPMGYYTERHLPAYDLLARDHCVCDAWHASVPADTWPNRLYAMAGREGTSVLKKPGVLREVLRRLRLIPGIGQLASAPVYEVDAFTHQLQLRQWRWYSHDPSTLRAADKGYRNVHDLNRENFAYFDRKRVGFITKAAEGGIVELHDGFLDDAAKGQLRDVSWIDPNFIDLKILDPNSNDDHPPSDVRAGQALVLETYEALVKSKGWENTLFVIVYDEHGGFYDHVDPPPKPQADPAPYRTLGVRVPALIVGPRVRKHVSHELFEHTTLIATILRCFAAAPEAALAAMPERVRRAPHLGTLLEPAPRKELLDRDRILGQIADARSQLDAARAAAREARRARLEAPSREPDGGAGQAQELHDWQEQFFGFAMAMRDAGLPAGQP